MKWKRLIAPVVFGSFLFILQLFRSAPEDTTLGSQILKERQRTYINLVRSFEFQDIDSCIKRITLENQLHMFSQAEWTILECKKYANPPIYQSFLAEILLHSGKEEQALAILNTPQVRIHPFNRHSILATYHQRRSEWRQAIQEIDLALESYDRLEPEPPARLLLQVAEIFLKQGDLTQAKANLQKALELKPGLMEARLFMEQNPEIQ